MDKTPPAAAAADEVTCKVHVHKASYSKEELLLSPETFPEIANGAIVFLVTRTGDAEHRVVLKATLLEKAGAADEKFASKRLALSLLKSVAEACGVAPWTDASVERVGDPERDAGADFCEFWFKDQFVSRADMWRFKRAVVGSSVHVGKRVDLNGLRATARATSGGISGPRRRRSCRRRRASCSGRGPRACSGWCRCRTRCGSRRGATTGPCTWSASWMGSRRPC